MTAMTEVIDVDTDPMTAFTIFTDEFDQWWGRGPIDAYDSWRLIERRIEGGVGGRVVEDYGDEERVLGTITVWEPGARLAWTTRNDVNDAAGEGAGAPAVPNRESTPERRGLATVTIDVTFRAHAAGTQVRVTGTVPAGVDGTSQLSMVRMAPQWFPRYLRRRAHDDPAADYGRLHLVLRSATPAATARWLADVFQLEPTADLPAEEGDPDLTWIELRVGTSFVVMWGGGGAIGTDSPFIYVDDLDAHLAHATAAGATIVSPITEHGFRSYTAADCEGRHWVFAQSGPRLGR